MGRIWHISDPHFGHSKVSKYRGFYTPDGQADVSSHDEAIYTSLTDVIEDNDTVFFYGDLSFNQDWQHGLDVIRQLKQERKNLQFWLLYGNHDIIHPLFKTRSIEVYSAYAEHFDWMGERLYNTTDYGKSVHFSHFPATNGDDRHSDKYKVWQIPEDSLKLNSPDADWVVHGHTHQDTFCNPTRPNHFCVSWDVFRAPVSDDFLKDSLHNVDESFFEPLETWGEWQKYRQQAKDLQKSGKE